MEEEKKERIKKRSDEVPFEQTKSATTYGVPNLPAPKKYICAIHGEIIAWDILWKTEGNVKKPFCEKCKNPVVPL
jgi:hypothetical protein